MQTLYDMVNAQTIVWPASLDNPTKYLIIDWFGDRECCDKPAKFNLYLRRTLEKNLPHYRELLKIEPGQEFVDTDGHTKIVSYDWLVKNYKARLVETSGTGASTKILTGSGGTTRTITNDGGETVTMYGSDMEHKGQIVNRGINDSKSEAVEKTGSSQTVSESGSSTDYESHTDTSAESSGSNSNSGSSTSKSLAKADPQSISYAGASGMPAALDWSYPGSQAEGAETSSESGSNTSSSESGTDVSGSSDVDANTKSATGTMGNESRETSSYRQDNSTDETDRQFGTQRTTEKVLNGGSTVEDVKDTEDTEETSSENNGISKEQESGRDIDIATLLEGAKRFIMGSDAWDFLYREVDKCFIGVTMEW